MKITTKILFSLSFFLGVVSLYLFITGHGAEAGFWLVSFFFSLALSFRGFIALKGLAFTILIFAAVSISMYFPAPFISLGSFEMKVLIVPLLQIIMFGMGTAMSLKDFHGVIKMPKGVLVGLLCQFSIMPLVGFSLATLFQFPPEIAAGIVLIGSSPSGLASNVMAYLANANVAFQQQKTDCIEGQAPIDPKTGKPMPIPRRGDPVAAGISAKDRQQQELENRKRRNIAAREQRKREREGLASSGPPSGGRFGGGIPGAVGTPPAGERQLFG